MGGDMKKYDSKDAQYQFLNETRHRLEETQSKLLKVNKRVLALTKKRSELLITIEQLSKKA